MALKSPVPFHEYWGIVPVATELPNVSGATIQDSALEVGDIAWVVENGKLYQCTTATVGAAVWDDLIEDPNAFHTDRAGEINALTAKGTPTTADVIMLEDWAAAYSKKKSPISGLPTALDANAIHSDTAAEISAVTEKTAVVDADMALIEDSAASNAKKMIEVGDIVGHEAANLWQRPATPHAEDDEFDVGTIDSDWEVYNANADTPGSFSSGAVDAYDATHTSGNVVRANQNDVRKSWILFQPPASSQAFYVGKPITAPTNLLVMARLKYNKRYTGETGNNDHRFGIGFFAQSGGYIEYQDAIEIFVSLLTTGAEYAKFFRRVGGSVLGTVNTTQVQTEGQALEYVAIHKLGTTYHGWVGTANGNWIYMGSQSHTGLTVAYAGFQMLNTLTSAPGVSVFGADFIRFLETDNFLF